MYAATEPMLLDDATGSAPIRVCVVGAGAIGLHVASTLHKGGATVSIMARGDSLEAIRANGVEVLDAEGISARYKINASDDPAEIGLVDYVIFCVKTYSFNAKMLAAIQPMLDVHTAVLPPTSALPWYLHPALEADAGPLAAAIEKHRLLSMVYWLSAVVVAPGAAWLFSPSLTALS